MGDPHKDANFKNVGLVGRISMQRQNWAVWTCSQHFVPQTLFRFFVFCNTVSLSFPLFDIPFWNKIEAVQPALLVEFRFQYDLGGRASTRSNAQPRSPSGGGASAKPSPGDQGVAAFLLTLWCPP